MITKGCHKPFLPGTPGGTDGKYAQKKTERIMVPTEEESRTGFWKSSYRKIPL